MVVPFYTTINFTIKQLHLKIFDFWRFARILPACFLVRDHDVVEAFALNIRHVAVIGGIANGQQNQQLLIRRAIQ